MTTTTTLPEVEQLRLALETPACCSDDLEAFMKSLEDSLPACCGDEHLAADDDDILSAVRTRDKADSVSSEASTSSSASFTASGGEASPSSSCAEQEEGSKAGEEGHEGSGEGHDGGGEGSTGGDEGSGQLEHGTDSAQAPDTNTSSRHGMVMRRRTEREYNLRSSSIINRIQTEQRRLQPRQPKPKAAPPPLSKYRRRTANSRERSRMREINDAFEVLRRSIPSYPAVEPSGVKLTKITTLRMALNYIGALREMLGYPQASQLMSQSVSQSANAGGDLNSVGSSNGSVSDTGSTSPGSCGVSPSIHDPLLGSPLPLPGHGVISSTGSDNSMEIDLHPDYHHDPCLGLLEDSEDEALTS